MKKVSLIIPLIFLVNTVFSQSKFGFRSGGGIYFDTFNANLLSSSADNTSAPELSIFGNPLPRVNDVENNKVYTDFGIKQEAFYKWNKKNEISFSFTYIKKPRAYNDLAELYWGENEDHREIYYQLVYSHKYWEKNKFSFQAGIGIAVNKLYVSRAVYDIDKDANGNYFIVGTDFYTSGKDPKQFDWGFPLKLQLNYNISENAAIGLNSDIIYLFQLGINNISIAPTIQISF
ncbi:hypothetical protein [Pedobacter cryophilus]|uniref:Outer membrane protein beta-barrel domain-containing protein n=1 Tax=Pedobacter cryophilus TaxID=2571271 RepID=A0A4V5P150_9SPHI|nr:hypothetical protein [Pedobacter cryophilus]TKC01071.1 hypothetical protein FA046_05175 [Pedobacter cryophilus]